MLARSVLCCRFVDSLILCNNGLFSPVHPRLRDKRLKVIDYEQNGGCLRRECVAYHEGASYVLFIDDDLLLSPEQIRMLFIALLREPERVHAPCGERWTPHKILYYQHGDNDELDVPSRAYACTQEHLQHFMQLYETLRHTPYQGSAAFFDDLILSLSGVSRPRCCAVGNLLSCPSSSDPHIAVYRSPNFTDQSRRNMHTFLASRELLPVACCPITDADIEHIHGPVHPPADGVIAICIVRDGEDHVASFIRHHRALGVKHIVLLDNGSSDATVTIASNESDVTVLRCLLPFKDHHLDLRRWLALQWCAGRWCLHVDIDERFLHPHAEQISLDTFIQYLEISGYDALVAHQLDMMSKGPISEIEIGDPMDTCPYYDLSAVRTVDERKRALLTGNNIQCLAGGVRGHTFGSDHFLLTKQPLFRVSNTVDPFAHSPHFVEHAINADCTGVLLHYKFTHSFLHQVQRAVREGQYWQDSTEYRLYDSTLRANRELQLCGPNARRFTGTLPLINQGFLRTSKSYNEFIKKFIET